MLEKDGEPFKVAVVLKKRIHLYAVFFEPSIDAIYLQRKILHSHAVLEKIGSVMSFTGPDLLLPLKLDKDPCHISATHPLFPHR